MPGVKPRQINDQITEARLRRLIRAALNQEIRRVQDSFPAAADFVFHEVPSGAVNGVNDTFTLSQAPEEGTVQVFKNGLQMMPGGSNDYTISGGTFTFVAAQIPQTGDNLFCHYITEVGA